MENRDLLDLFGFGKSSIFSVGDMLLAMSVSAALSLIYAWTYKKTHTGPNYSRVFLSSMFIMSVSTSVVMLIIGSNIARAFSLIGALSIIRFRTAVKDPRDTAFLFAAVVSGMGCGTGFYVPAILLTLFLCIMLLILDKANIGQKSDLSTILKLNVSESTKIEDFKDSMAREFKNIAEINKVHNYSSKSVTYVFSAIPRSKNSIDSFEAELNGKHGINETSVYQSDQFAPF